MTPKESPEPKPAKPETPRVRMLPTLIAVVIGAVLLLGVALGIVYLVAGDKTKAIRSDLWPEDKALNALRAAVACPPCR